MNFYCNLSDFEVQLVFGMAPVFLSLANEDFGEFFGEGGHDFDLDSSDVSAKFQLKLSW